MSDKITTYLEEVKARAAAATPGPWGLHVSYPYGKATSEVYFGPEKKTLFSQTWGTSADIDFVIGARQDIPRLVAALETAIAGLEYYKLNEGEVASGCCLKDYDTASKAIAEIDAILKGQK